MIIAGVLKYLNGWERKTLRTYTPFYECFIFYFEVLPVIFRLTSFTKASTEAVDWLHDVSIMMPDWFISLT